MYRENVGEILYMVRPYTNTLVHGSTVLLLEDTTLHSLSFILPHDNLKLSSASI